MTYLSPDARKLADLKAMNLAELADIGAKPADVERALRQTIARSAPNALSLVGQWCRDFIRATQYGRMKSVLAHMPDDVLDEIGISRSEIPSYARSLIDGDGT